MQRALDSAIGLPRRSTSALSMVVLVMPAEVRRNLNGCSFARGVGVVLPSEGLIRGARIIVRRSRQTASNLLRAMPAPLARAEEAARAASSLTRLRVHS